MIISAKLISLALSTDVLSQRTDKLRLATMSNVEFGTGLRVVPGRPLLKHAVIAGQMKFPPLDLRASDGTANAPWDNGACHER